MDALHGHKENALRKSLRRTTQECNKLSSTNAGSNTPQDQQLYGHLPPISKAFKRDEQDMWDIAGETRTNSCDVPL